jgi:ribosomal protein S14
MEIERKCYVCGRKLRARPDAFMRHKPICEECLRELLARGEEVEARDDD